MTSALQVRLADSVARAQQAEDSLAILHVALGRPASGTPSWSDGEVTTLVVGALRGVMRITDTVVCTDAQEAWVLLPGCDFDGAAGAADRAAAALEDLEPAVGIAIYPDHSAQPTWLTQHAELASNRAREHRSAFAFAEANDGDEPAGAAIIHELPNALRERRIVQHYQPQVELGSRRVVGVEALARWDHPERGLLAPAEFLPLAHVTRLGRDVDLEMARAAARQSARWEAEGRRLPIAFNVGARTLRWPGLIGALREILAAEGASASLLKVEVHEEALTLDPMAAATLKEIRVLGLGVVVEGFGGGPASLATVERLAVDELKLDPALIHFARDPRQVGVLASIVAGGHALGLKVGAPHLDTEALVRSTWGLGCDLGQGFALGRAVPAEELAADTPAVSVPAAAMRPVAAARPVIRLPRRPRVRIPVPTGAVRFGSAAALVAAGMLAGAIPYGGTTLSAAVAAYLAAPANAILGTSHALPPASQNGNHTTQSTGASAGSNGTGSGTQASTGGHSGTGTGSSGTGTTSGTGSSSGTGTSGGGTGSGLPTPLPSILPTPLPSAPLPVPSLPTAP